ncbi:MAG TPA: helix-turn-helix domain-containing protein [Azospirillum sp.]
MTDLLTLDDVRKLVRAERKRRGLTQGDAAGLIGHTQKWLSDFENGKADPPTSMTLKLLVLLGIPLRAGVAAESATAPPEAGLDEREVDIDEGL